MSRQIALPLSNQAWMYQATAMIRGIRPLRLALLTLAVVLIDQGEKLLADLAHQDLFSGFSFLPVLIGVLLLAPLDEFLLSLIFIGLKTSHMINGQELNTGGVAQLIARGLALGLCVGASHLRTQLYRSEQQLKARTETLAHERDASLRVAALAHEIRQPLTALQLHLRQHLHRLEKNHGSNGAQAASLEQLVISTDQLADTVIGIEALLHNVKRARQQIDLAAIVHKELQRLEARLRGAGVELCCVGLDQPQLLLGDPQQLGIACRNLLDNALDALLTVPVPQRRLQVRLLRSDKVLQLEIADSGPGLPSLDLEQLKLSSHQPTGVGLGLMTVQAIAAQHNGQLELARSADLGGALVRISCLL